jgi:hypothetical protein
MCGVFAEYLVPQRSPVASELVLGQSLRPAYQFARHPAARTAHAEPVLNGLASSITVSGILLFRLLVAAPALRLAGEEVPGSDALHRLLARILWISLAVASAVAWLLAMSAKITGGDWTEVIADDVA